MNKKGFTLAETLITLVVLGVIAAVLIPTIMNVAPDNNKVMFKKAYSTLERTVSELINDETKYPAGTSWSNDGGTTNYNCADTGGTPAVDCGFHNTYLASNTTDNKFGYLFSQQLNTVGTVTLLGKTTANGTGNNIFTTTDGITWYVRIPVADDYNARTTPSSYDNTLQFPTMNLYLTKVLVDVNGKAKGPNCSADSGIATYKPSSPSPDYTLCSDATDPCKNKPDVFIFGIRYDGKIAIGSGVSGASTDTCAENILSSPTNIK